MAHNVFRRDTRYQLHRRCTTCGHVAKSVREQIAHANGDQEEP